MADPSPTLLAGKDGSELRSDAVEVVDLRGVIPRGRYSSSRVGLQTPAVEEAAPAAFWRGDLAASGPASAMAAAGYFPPRAAKWRSHYT
jgi:hypothetical protein